ncbi:MAG: dihydropteroate synthase, partial [Oscillospiraceae bacterium]|nr:dihydropteroate synthase [Oscillospiraceae bacterium]
LDSADPRVLEAGARTYNGRPIIKSLTGAAASMDAVFPIVKKYGALAIALTMDENGVPQTARERYLIAERILRRAAEYGIAKSDILIDCLAPASATRQDQTMETLRAVSLVKNGLGVKTVLGIGHIARGLPAREKLNAAFLTAALGAGLDAAILDVFSEENMEALNLFRILSGDKPNTDV